MYIFIKCPINRISAFPVGTKPAAFMDFLNMGVRLGTNINPGKQVFNYSSPNFNTLGINRPFNSTPKDSANKVFYKFITAKNRNPITYSTKHYLEIMRQSIFKNGLNASKISHYFIIGYIKIRSCCDSASSDNTDRKST